METLQIEKFNPTKQVIQLKIDEAKLLTINGIDDKDGYNKVDIARKELKQIKSNIKNTGKDLRADAVAFQKAVIEKEKELTDLIIPVEKDLQEKQDCIDLEKEKIKRLVLLPNRKEQLAKINITVEDDFILLLDENSFTEFLNKKTSEFLEIQQQKFRAEQEAKEKEMAEQQRKVRAEQEAKEKEINDALFKIETEKRLKAELEEKNRVEQENIIKKEEELKRLKAEEDKKIQKQKKYKNWLVENGYTEDTKQDFVLDTKQSGKVILLKIVSVYQIE